METGFTARSCGSDHRWPSRSCFQTLPDPETQAWCHIAFSLSLLILFPLCGFIFNLSSPHCDQSVTDNSGLFPSWLCGLSELVAMQSYIDPGARKKSQEHLSVVTVAIFCSLLAFFFCIIFILKHKLHQNIICFNYWGFGIHLKFGPRKMFCPFQSVLATPTWPSTVSRS
jgi:hypothetical protein